MGPVNWVFLAVLFCLSTAFVRLPSDSVFLDDCAPKDVERAFSECRAAFDNLRSSQITEHEATGCCIFLGTKVCLNWRLADQGCSEDAGFSVLSDNFGVSEELCGNFIQVCNAAKEFRDILSAQVKLPELVLLHRGGKSSEGESLGPEYTQDLESATENIEEHTREGNYSNPESAVDEEAEKFWVFESDVPDDQKPENALVGLEDGNLSKFPQVLSAELPNSLGENSTMEYVDPSFGPRNSPVLPNVISQEKQNASTHTENGDTLTEDNYTNCTVSSDCEGGNTSRVPKQFTTFHLPTGDGGIIVDNFTLYDPRGTVKSNGSAAAANESSSTLIRGNLKLSNVSVEADSLNSANGTRLDRSLDRETTVSHNNSEVLSYANSETRESLDIRNSSGNIGHPEANSLGETDILDSNSPSGNSNTSKEETDPSSSSKDNWNSTSVHSFREANSLDESFGNSTEENESPKIYGESNLSSNTTNTRSSRNFGEPADDQTNNTEFTLGNNTSANDSDIGGTASERAPKEYSIQNNLTLLDDGNCSQTDNKTREFRTLDHGYEQKNETVSTGNSTLNETRSARNDDIDSSNGTLSSQANDTNARIGRISFDTAGNGLDVWNSLFPGVGLETNFSSLPTINSSSENDTNCSDISGCHSNSTSRVPQTFTTFHLPTGDGGVIVDNSTLYDPRNTAFLGPLVKPNGSAAAASEGSSTLIRGNQQLFNVSEQADSLNISANGTRLDRALNEDWNVSHNSTETLDYANSEMSESLTSPEGTGTSDLNSTNENSNTSREETDPVSSKEHTWNFTSVHGFREANSLDESFGNSTDENKGPKIYGESNVTSNTTNTRSSRHFAEIADDQTNETEFTFGNNTRTNDSNTGGTASERAPKEYNIQRNLTSQDRNNSQSDNETRDSRSLAHWSELMNETVNTGNNTINETRSARDSGIDYSNDSLSQTNYTDVRAGRIWSDTTGNSSGIWNDLFQGVSLETEFGSPQAKNLSSAGITDMLSSSFWDMFTNGTSMPWFDSTNSVISERFNNTNNDTRMSRSSETAEPGNETRLTVAVTEMGNSLIMASNESDNSSYTEYSSSVIANYSSQNETFNEAISVKENGTERAQRFSEEEWGAGENDTQNNEIITQEREERSFPLTTYTVELGRKDLEDFLTSVLDFVTLMDNECSGGAQSELNFKLKGIVFQMCSAAKGVCFSKRQPRQNSVAWPDWLASWLQTSTTTTESPLDLVLGENNTGANFGHQEDPSLQPTLPHLGQNPGKSASNSSNFTDPSSLANLVMAMELESSGSQAHEATGTSDGDQGTTQTSSQGIDIVFSSGTSPWCLSSLIVLVFLRLANVHILI